MVVLAARKCQWEEGNGKDLLQTVRLLRCLKEEPGGGCLCPPLKRKGDKRGRFCSFLVMYPEEITEHHNAKAAEISPGQEILRPALSGGETEAQNCEGAQRIHIRPCRASVVKPQGCRAQTQSITPLTPSSCLSIPRSPMEQGK